MPVFRPSLTQQYGPKSLKLADLYSHATKTNLSDSVKAKLVKALMTDHGYKVEDARDLFNKNLTPTQAKQIASELNKSAIPGFKRSANGLINDYIRKEAIKGRNVARVRHDIAIEARQEPLESITKTPKTGNAANRTPLKKLY